MKKIVGILLATLTISTTSKAQLATDSLIFPEPDKFIRVVKLIDYKEFPVGEYAKKNDSLANKILNELKLPFHKMVIRMSQCARNLVGDTSGYNILFLSNEEGGFARQGVIIKDAGKETSFQNLNYVDLVIDEKDFENSALSIYSHELGHVMMAIILKELPQGNSVLQHVSMGITDYYKAFSEGWGEHFEIQAYNNIAKYQDYFLRKNNYSNTSFLWNSSQDAELRQNATLQNKYVFEKLLPENIYNEELNEEQLILSYHTSPIFNIGKLKNGQQMLSCEGMLSSLFYLINTNEVLQKNYAQNDFYSKFLISKIPSGVNASDLFSPYENIMLKNFWVWYKIKDKLLTDKKTPIFITFLNEWCNLFPNDKYTITKIFISATAGKTISNEPGFIYEKMAFYGMLGDYVNYKKYKKDYEDALTRAIDFFNNSIVIRQIDENIGEELWVENKNLLIKTTLWSEQNKVPLNINLNTASIYELASFPKVGIKKAKKLVKKREELGYFKTITEAKKYGFKF